MIVVIQCAASKRPDAGSLLTRDGTPVHFVGDPDIAPADPDRVYARPDDLTENGKSWREILLMYNKQSIPNKLGLHPAYSLYENKTYSRLVASFGEKQVYILSAGWGLLRADFLTPHYDITLSSKAEPYKRRKKTDVYSDFRFPKDIDDEILFFGGSSYLFLFQSLTSTVGARKIAFYNLATPPNFDGCEFRLFKTRTRTNWHYECANAVVDGIVDIG